MSTVKEIRTRIRSIKNTQKTTRAMEMVAASKMRKAQDRMARSRPYADKIRGVIRHLAHAHSEYHHPFLEAREVKRVGYIVVSTDRGLCGGLNVNLFRKAVSHMQSMHDDSVDIDLCVIGKKGQAFFQRFHANIVGAASNLGDTPKSHDLIGIVKVMLDAYYDNKIDALYIVHNEFVNTMTQSPQVTQMLPLEKTEEETYEHHWDYIYEPDERGLMDQLLNRYIESQVYQGVVENFACQQAATMVAMKSASDNAGELIKEFELAYNKARQASITQEISEIVGGAAAV